MTETEGLAGVQHGARMFVEGGTVQVTTETSGRRGELAEVLEIRGGSSWSIVARHPDGQERVWRPDELAVVAS